MAKCCLLLHTVQTHRHIEIFTQHICSIFTNLLRCDKSGYARNHISNLTIAMCLTYLCSLITFSYGLDTQTMMLSVRDIGHRCSPYVI